jgi:hypothetical protein
MLTAVMLFGFFVDFVVRDMAVEALQPFIDCFDLLRIMLVIFQRGNSNDLPTLRGAMHPHHELYMQLYHPIAKLHGQIHIVDYWEYWGTLLSCFGPERHHKLFKRVMGYTYNRGDRSCLAHDVRNWVRELNSETLYEPTHLAGTKRRIHYEMPWPGSAAPITFHTWAASLMTEQSSMIAKGDLLQYDSGSLGVAIGFAVGFAQTDAAHMFQYAAFLWPCEMVTLSVWNRQDRRLIAIQADAIVGAVPYKPLQDAAIAVMLHPTS